MRNLIGSKQQQYPRCFMPIIMNAKRARQTSLNELSTCGINDAALSRVLTKIRNQPALLEALHGSQEVLRQVAGAAKLELLRECKTTVRIPMLSGPDYHLAMLLPQKMLPLWCEKSPGIKQLFTEVLRAQPIACRPWRFLLYHDELTPGNVLKPDNKRKLTCIYASWLELQHHLRDENAWFPMSVIRHDTIVAAKGGMSGCLRAMLLACFSDDTWTTGILLPLAEPTLMICKFYMLIADEAALKASWQAKGAAGIRPCLGCKNVCKKGHLTNHDATNLLVDITEDDFAKCQPATDEEFYALVDHLLQQTRVLNKTQLDNLEKAAGLTASEDGLLACVELRPHVKPSSSRFDSMHCFYAHGIVGVEVHLFLDACNREVGMKFEHLIAFCSAGWISPACHGNANVLAKQVFSASREKASKETFKGMASELLGVMPLLRQAAEMIIAPSGALANELASFRAMGAVVEQLQLLKNSFRPSTADCDKLQSLLKAHFQVFKATWGNDNVLPKHHFALHIPTQVAQDGMLIDAFVLERKHRVFKKHATTVQNTSQLEDSVLSRAVVEQLQATAQADAFSDRLEGPMCECPEIALALGVQRASIAETVRCRGIRIAVKDVVIIDGKAAIVKAAVRTEAGFELLISTCQFVRKVGVAIVWQCNRDIVVFSPLQEFHLASYWNFESHDVMMVLV